MEYEYGCFFSISSRLGAFFLKDTKATARWVRKPRRPTTAAAWWRRCMEKVTETEDAALEATTDSVRDKTRLFRCGSAEGIWTRSGPRSKKWKLVFFFKKGVAVDLHRYVYILIYIYMSGVRNKLGEMGEIDMIWVVPSPSNSGKSRIIRIPYKKYSNPGGGCYRAGGQPKIWYFTWPCQCCLNEQIDRSLISWRRDWLITWNH